MVKKVTVVILNYKLKDQTIDCIKSVEKSTYPSLEIVVVDNNSEDGLGKEILNFPNVKFIQNNDNLGYAGGNNVGIKYALEKGSDYIFILNPDTTLDKDAIKFLVERLEDPKVGIVSPKVYFSDSQKIWYAGGIFDKANVLGSHRGVDQQDKKQYDESSETDFATGAALVIKKQAFEEIGFFDERYFLYYEESDFCYRAKLKGFKIMYIPKAVVYHKNAQATGLGSPLQDYFITRNRMLFAAKFLPLRTRFALFREALRNLGNPVRRLAFFDFLIGNFGKGSFLK